MVSEDRVRTIQRLYPLLYFACHDSHTRSDGLSERDLRILHHASGDEGAYASGLARHLGVGRSTLSEAVSSLERRGLVIRENDGPRRKRIRLTKTGVAAIESRDGLDPQAIAAVLAQLDETEQDQVVAAFELVATAIERKAR